VQWGAASRRDGGLGCHQASSGASTRPSRGGAATSSWCVSVRWWMAHENAPQASPFFYSSMLSQHATEVDLRRRLINCIGVCICFFCFPIFPMQSIPHQYFTAINFAFMHQMKGPQMPNGPSDLLIYFICAIYVVRMVLKN
jgi:hypothetical protein